MNKSIIIGTALGIGLVGYKVGVYMSILHKIKQEKRQKVVSLGTLSEYKAKLEKEKEK